MTIAVTAADVASSAETTIAATVPQADHGAPSAPQDSTLRNAGTAHRHAALVEQPGERRGRPRPLGVIEPGQAHVHLADGGAREPGRQLRRSVDIVHVFDQQGHTATPRCAGPGRGPGFIWTSGIPQGPPS